MLACTILTMTEKGYNSIGCQQKVKKKRKRKKKTPTQKVATALWPLYKTA